LDELAVQTGDLAVVVDVDDSVVTPLRPTTRSRSSVSDLITSDSDAPIETPSSDGSADSMTLASLTAASSMPTTAQD